MLPFCAASMLVVACAWLVPGAAVPLISLSIETNENAIWFQTKSGQRRAECQPEQAQCLRSSSSLAWPQIFRSSLVQWGARAFCSPKPACCWPIVFGKFTAAGGLEGLMGERNFTCTLAAVVQR